VDRDGITRPGNVVDRLYADLAQSFSARGWATLRYDPRGHGQSTAPSGTAIQLSDIVGDAQAGLGFLAGRQEINPQRLTILGDGWGGLVAMQVAGQDSRAGRVVLVSTPGRSVVDTVADQLQAAAASPADGQRQVQQLRTAVATLEAGGHLPATGDLDPALRPILQQSQEGYLRSIFSIDPVALAQQVRVATLIVRGSQDPAITTADTNALSTAIGTPATVLIASGAGHTLDIETPSKTTATTSAPAANSAIQNVLGAPQQAVTRDTFTVAAIGNWMAPPAPPPAPPPGPYTPPPGGGTGR
jgi:pimeloyl-ACP methyl ester carboxylesterase